MGYFNLLIWPSFYIQHQTLKSPEAVFAKVLMLSVPYCYWCTNFEKDGLSFNSDKENMCAGHPRTLQTLSSVIKISRSINGDEIVIRVHMNCRQDEIIRLTAIC